MVLFYIKFVKIYLTVLKMTEIFYTKQIDHDATGVRIDKFISSSYPDFSRAQIQRLIESSSILVNEEAISDKNYKTKLGDIYKIIVPEPEAATPIPENIPLNILYEDNDIIVVNKESGMTVHPAAGAYHGTLVNALLYHCKDSLSGIGGVARPGIVHRIDRNTSGILVVAKNDLSHNRLSEQFSEHTIERTYYALVYGVPNPLKGTIEGNIARSSYDRKKMALVKTGGKHAITHYETIARYSNSISLVKCNLETGRTHQIRVHLSSIGCHLVGDDIYKGRRGNLPFPEDIKKLINTFPRQALHAKSLGFTHPKTSEKLQFDSVLPDDIQNLLNILEKYKL